MMDRWLEQQIRITASRRQKAGTLTERHTAVLRDLCRKAYQQGTNVTVLAGAAGVSRPTMYQWLKP